VVKHLKSRERVVVVDGVVAVAGYLVQDLIEKYDSIVAVDPELADIYMEYAIDSPWFKLVEITHTDELLAELIEAKYILDNQKKPLLLLCGEKPRECHYLLLLHLLNKKPLEEAGSYVNNTIKQIFPNYREQQVVDELRVVEDVGRHLSWKKLYTLYSLSASYGYGRGRAHLSKTLYFAYILRKYSNNVPLLYTLTLLHTLLEDKSGEKPAKIYKYRRELIESITAEIDPLNYREINNAVKRISEAKAVSREEAITLIACTLALSTVERIDVQKDKLLVLKCQDAKKCLKPAEDLKQLIQVVGISKITYTEEAISGNK